MQHIIKNFQSQWLLIITVYGVWRVVSWEGTSVTNLPFCMHFRSVSFAKLLSTLPGVSRVVCGAHLCSLGPGGTRLLSWWMLHWWQVNGSTARESFPCTHPSTPSVRLHRSQASFYKPLVRPHREFKYTYQLSGACSICVKAVKPGFFLRWHREKLLGSTSHCYGPQLHTVMVHWCLSVANDSDFFLKMTFPYL